MDADDTFYSRELNCSSATQSKYWSAKKGSLAELNFNEITLTLVSSLNYQRIQTFDPD